MKRMRSPRTSTPSMPRRGSRDGRPAGARACGRVVARDGRSVRALRSLDARPASHTLRTMRTLVGLALALATALALPGCRYTPPAATTRDPAVAAVAGERAGLSEPGVRGKILYETYCSVCHGAEGHGDGFNAPNLTPPPPNLPEVLAARGDTLVAAVIRGGSTSIGKSPLCPPHERSLDGTDRELILLYLREGFARPAASGEKR